MNPRYWLYILPMALLGLFIVIRLTSTSASKQEIKAYTSPQKPTEVQKTVYASKDKPTIDSVQLTDTARVAN